MMHSYIGEERGMFGPLSDMFGFDDLSQAAAAAAADPLASINAPLVLKAKNYLAEFGHLKSLIPGIRDVATRAEAQAIVDTKWYPPFNILNPFRTAKDDLNKLASEIAIYVKEPFGQFVRFGDNFSITRTRETRLSSFRKGVKELRKFMATKIILPTEVIDRGSEMLIASARSLAAKAKATMQVGDIAAARAAAESARESALPEGKDDIVREANAIMAAMDVLASKTIAPSAGKTAGAETDLNTIILIGGGALVVVGAILLLTRK